MRRHAKVFDKVINATHLNSQSDAERHGNNHKQRVEGAVQTHREMAVKHVTDEVYQRHARYNKQGTSHKRMPGCATMKRRRKPLWQCIGNQRHRQIG